MFPQHIAKKSPKRKIALQVSASFLLEDTQAIKLKANLFNYILQLKNLETSHCFDISPSAQNSYSYNQQAKALWQSHHLI